MTTETHADAHGIVLDPFVYVPGAASRIRGLGGETAFHDPAYAFHTAYVPVNPGPARFILRFRGLAAKKGTLAVRVGMQPQEPGAPARLADTERITFNRLISMNGELAIAFEGYRNVHFAVMGHIFDATDASAEALEVLLDQSPAGAAEEEIVADGRTTSFGQEAARPVSKLISTGRASFIDPVSQLATSRQFAEPAYAACAARLGETVAPDRRQWERCFLLQVLGRYGVLAAGARGLGFSAGPGALPAAIAAEGVELVATLPPREGEEAEHMIEALRRPALCDPATFDRAVNVRHVDPNHVANDLVNFDFAWSLGVLDELDSAQAGIRFMERVMGCVRPGGLVVHTGGYDLSVNGDAVDGRSSGLFRRRELEQLALMFISRGHEVAQVKIDSGIANPRDLPEGDPARVTSFAIIARKAASRF